MAATPAQLLPCLNAPLAGFVTPSTLVRVLSVVTMPACRTAHTSNIFSRNVEATAESAGSFICAGSSVATAYDFVNRYGSLQWTCGAEASKMSTL